MNEKAITRSLSGEYATDYLAGQDNVKTICMQAGSLITALPFTPILLLMCLSLYKGLKTEVAEYSFRKNVVAERSAL